MSKSFMILEGIDGTGKSTLARHLQEQIQINYDLKVKIVHNSRPPKNIPGLDYYNQQMRHADYLYNVHDTFTIFDRSFIGGIIYPITFAYKPTFNYADFHALLSFAIRIGHFVFIIPEDRDEIKSANRRTIGDQSYDSFVASIYENAIFDVYADKVIPTNSVTVTGLIDDTNTFEEMARILSDAGFLKSAKKNV